MLLSIAMLADALPFYISNRIFHGYETFLNLENCAILGKESKLRNDIVYLVSTEQSSLHRLKTIDCEEKTAVIVLGEFDPSIINPKAAYLFIKPGNVHFFDLVNSVIRVFEQFNKIEQHLNQAVMCGKSLQEIVDIMTPVFDNEIWIRNFEFRRLAGSYPNSRILAHADVPQHGADELSTPEEINLLQSNPDYIQQNPVDEPFFYHDPGFDRNSYIYDLYIQKHFIYRIIVADTNHSLRSYDKALLSFFAQIIRNHYNLSAGAQFLEDKSTLNSVFLDLIKDQSSYSEEQLRKKIILENWNLEDRQICICMKANRNDWQLHNYAFYAKYLFKSFPFMFAFEYDDMIVCVANLDAGYRGNLSELISQLTYFVREENFRAGISEIFTNLIDLKYYFSEAKVTLELGLEHTPTRWICNFSDYTFHYISSKLSSEIPNHIFITKKIQKLIDYDKENATEYNHTLRAFLDCKMNLTEAGRKLFIHRTTLNYRLKKISQITDIDLENKDEILLLELGYRILKL